ncbi:hypothetical protein [Mucilaginibacter ginsenosidivorax]|uniref:Lipoprotein n=1 Tax=Mucilaginibacter ginsenosidivorax TaxID=862126 RepID=A0A5B8VUL6_9SPHI|nr:hypothetical protein [Mucilaginibacter ginsenosidivorax]QEC75277.1 hypothetical protein FSB76_04735 [Mucilaginibacter ginsenosidivorax]
MPAFTKIIAICLLTLSACSSSPRKNPAKNQHKKVLAAHEYINTRLSGTGKIPREVFIVDSTAAVFTILDTTEIQKRHKASTDEEFYAGADDQVFYTSEARTFLKKQPVKIIELDPAYKYLEFKQANGVVHRIKLDTVAFISNLYFFNPQKQSHNVDMLDVEAEYKKYFGK